MSTSAQASDGSLDVRVLAQQLAFIALVIGVPVGLGTASHIFCEGDVSWHIAAGNWIVNHARIPTSDPFSFTAAGHPWVSTEWLAEVILGSVFRLAGYAGLATLIGAALVTLNAIIFFHLQRRASAAVLWVSLLAMNVVLAPFVFARPHVLAWPLLAGWTVLLLKYGKEGRPPPLWSALLLVLWTNLHTSFPLAAPIAAAIALDSLVAVQWKTLRQWLLFAFVCLIAICANANGIAGLTQPFHISGLAMLSAIQEWNPTTTHDAPQFFIVLVAGLGLLLWRGVRIPAGRLGLLLLTLVMAFMHMRHQSAFIILAACIVPPLIPSKKIGSPVPPLLVLMAVPLLGVRAFMPLALPSCPANPRSLIAAIPPQLRSEPVFNEYTFGGPLILAGVKPYIDGRAELYGDGFVLEYAAIARGDLGKFERAADRYGISWTMLPADSALEAELEKSGKWRRVYADGFGVIDVRDELQTPAGDPSTR